MGVTRFPGATTRQQDFTSSGTWTCPSGVYSADFLVVGAGGGGGGTSVSSATFYAAGGGGGGGAVKKVNLNVTPGNTYTITVGAKGTGASAAIGGNGGFSEVLLSGTTLIRSFGGQGGGACIADTSTLPTISRTLAGGGGEGSAANTNISQMAGGGGGASNGGNGIATLASASTATTYSAEGTPGNRTGSTTGNVYLGFGTGGIDGYGAGGSGGSTNISTRNLSGASYFAGVGNLQTTSGAAGGTAAVANTGCGGGGGASHTSATSTTGGNGADGLVRVVYFA